MDKVNKIKCGLVGYPVGHSLSPVMHNAAFRKYNLDYQYSLYPIEPAKFNDFIQSLNKQNIKGLNVTVPYKEKILPYLNHKSHGVKSIGAANTIIAEEDNIKGFNTDFLGFSKHIKEIINPSNLRVALLGAGGAARAVVYSLLKDNAKSISIFDIDLNKSDQLIKIAEGWIAEFGVSTVINQAKNVKELNISDKDLLVNATPVGLKKDDSLIVDKSFLHKNLVVYDLIYNPALTALLLAAKEKGLKFSNGLGMLIYQGAQSFLHFSGAGIEVAEVAGVMREALNKEGI